jgi:hypothetical protein
MSKSVDDTSRFFVRGRVVLRRECSCTVPPSHGFARAARVRPAARVSPAASPAFSGPRSRAGIARCRRCLVNHAIGAPAAWRPRMGPAPASATAGLRDAGSRRQKTIALRGWVGGDHARERRAAPRHARAGLQATTTLRGAGGLGMRAQAPFAVAPTLACCFGVDAITVAHRGARPRAWAGERVPGPPAPAQDAGTRAKQATKRAAPDRRPHAPPPRPQGPEPQTPCPACAKTQTQVRDTPASLKC